MRFPKPVCQKTGKVAFMSWGSANDELARIQEKWERNHAGFDVPPCRVFKCEHCHFFHLTHAPKRPLVDAPPLESV